MSHPDPNHPAKQPLPLAPGSRPATPTTPQRGSPIPVYLSRPRRDSLTDGVGLSPGNSPPNSPREIYEAHLSRGSSPTTGRPRRSSSLSRQQDADAFEDPNVYEVAISRPPSPLPRSTTHQPTAETSQANALGQTPTLQAIAYLQDVMLRGRPLPEHPSIPTSHPGQATPSTQVQQRDQPSSSGSAPLSYFTSLLDQGLIDSGMSKLDELCTFLDPAKKEQRSLVFRLATQVSPSSRGQKLTMVLAHWVLSSGENDKLVADLLRSQLNQVDDFFGDLMDFDELDGLMDMQFLLEDVRKLLEPTATAEEKSELRARILSAESWASLMK